MRILLLAALLLPQAKGTPAVKRDEALTAKTGLFKREFKKSFYMLNVPGGYKPEKKHGLILFMHGSGGRAEGAIGTFGMALSKDYILISPETIASDRLAWDPDADGENIVDMIQEVMKIYSIDPDRILASGFSAGGAQTIPQICKRTDLFTAGSPCGGCCYNEGLLANPSLAFYIFAGKQDFAWGGAKLAYEELDKKGFNVRFVDPDNLGHAMEPGGWQKIFDWFDGLIPEAQRPYLAQARELVAKKSYGRAGKLLKQLAQARDATRHSKDRAAVINKEITAAGETEIALAKASGDAKKAADILTKAKLAFDGSEIGEKIDAALKELTKK